MKKEQKLKIKYSFRPTLKPEDFKLTDKLDKKLEKIVKDFGFEFEGSGYNFKTKERDLGFYKTN